MVLITSKKLIWMSLVAGSIFFHSSPAEAAGKKPAGPSCGDPTAPVLSTPFPVRKVILQPIGTRAFQLPNGSNINLSADLQEMLQSIVAQSNTFSPSDPTPPDSCDTHLEIRAAVTTLQLDIAQFGISVGYTPSGPLSGVTGIDGSAKVKVGAISMAFGVYKCVAGTCVAPASTISTQVTAGLDLNLDINFAEVKTGTSLIVNTPLGQILKNIMKNGINTVASSPRLNELPWYARVRDVQSGAGILTFDAGYEDRLSLNQAFEIYAPANPSSSGVCDVYRTVAYVHTTAVNTVSSTAIVDQVLDSRGVLPGDVVMVHVVNAK
jgi:hypothetical protein